MPSEQLQHLFQPCRVGRWTMKNRIAMSALTRCRADDDHVPTPMMAEYYSSRASMGLIITESTIIEEGYSGMAYEPGIYSAAQIAGWKRVTDAVHAKGGLIALQVYHPGRATVQANIAEGVRVVAPSPLPIPPSKERCIAAWCRDGREQPFAQQVHAMTKAEIARHVLLFVQAAQNAMEAGFDAVELHAGTGFLIDQFLRTSSNQRTDEYGGSVANRCRFLFEVVDAVIAAVPADRVGVRLTPLDSFNGQSDENPEALTTYICSELDRRRVAFIDLFRGDPAAKVVARSDLWARKAFGGAILASHGYADAAAAAAAIAEGAVDAVCFGMPSVSNPDLAWRIWSNTPYNKADFATFFTRDAKGYIDYPSCEPERFCAEMRERAERTRLPPRQYKTPLQPSHLCS